MITTKIFLQGLCKICIGCKLQEVVACYQSEDWSHVYIACAGTDTQALIDTLESMFSKPTLNIKELDTETRQERKQASPITPRMRLRSLFPRFQCPQNSVSQREWCLSQRDSNKKIYQGLVNLLPGSIMFVNCVASSLKTGPA